MGKMYAEIFFDVIKTHLFVQCAQFCSISSLDGTLRSPAMYFTAHFAWDSRRAAELSRYCAPMYRRRPRPPGGRYRTPWNCRKWIFFKKKKILLAHYLTTFQNCAAFPE